MTVHYVLGRTVMGSQNRNYRWKELSRKQTKTKRQNVCGLPWSVYMVVTSGLSCFNKGFSCLLFRLPVSLITQDLGNSFRLPRKADRKQWGNQSQSQMHLHMGTNKPHIHVMHKHTTHKQETDRDRTQRSKSLKGEWAKLNANIQREVSKIENWRYFVKGWETTSDLESFESTVAMWPRERNLHLQFLSTAYLG